MMVRADIDRTWQIDGCRVSLMTEGLTVQQQKTRRVAMKYDAASDTFTPATLADQPKTRDYVFTDYGKR